MKKINQKILLKEVLQSTRPFSVTVDFFKSPLEGELLLSCEENGVNDWILRFSYTGDFRSIAIGVFPMLSLEQARDKAKAALRLAYKGIDPAFENQRKEWLGKTKLIDYVHCFKERMEHCNIVADSLLTHVSNLLGDYPFSMLTENDFKIYIESADTKEEKKKIHIALAIFFDFLIENKKNFSQNLDLHEVKKLSDSLEREDIKISLSIYIDEWYGQIIQILDEKRKKSNYKTRSTLFALSLLPYLAVSPQILLLMKWEDINWKERIWKILVDNEKTFIIPLSNQVIDILTSLNSIRFCKNGYVFQSAYTNSKQKAISISSLSISLNNIGFLHKEITPIGFKMYAEKYFFNSCLYSTDMIKIQLNKKLPNKAIYKAGPEVFLEKRREMMQNLADHLDNLKKCAADKKKL